jgi:ABC-type amino acid transport substrate-binding protein|tara:strand:- start:5532 stop:5840 length:309 start_codon:yes stop_codon:yes gene_type:complete
MEFDRLSEDYYNRVTKDEDDGDESLVPGLTETEPEYVFGLRPTADPLVNKVINRMVKRSAEGIEKYKVTMLREDVSTAQWIDHAIEELLDAAIYLERLKRDL